MAYSLTKTYIIWFFFGWLGIHHLYLGRLNHAIVWYATLGGGCGVGWLRDFWRIPSYVEWAKAKGEHQREHKMRMKSRRYPPCSCFKFFGMFIMGYLAALMFSGTIPNLTEDDRRSYPLFYFVCSLSSKILYATGAVLCTHLVANIGETKCKLKVITRGCLFSLPFVIWSDDSEWTLMFVVLVSGGES